MRLSVPRFASRSLFLVNGLGQGQVFVDHLKAKADSFSPTSCCLPVRNSASPASTWDVPAYVRFKAVRCPGVLRSAPSLRSREYPACA